MALAVVPVDGASTPLLVLPEHVLHVELTLGVVHVLLGPIQQQLADGARHGLVEVIGEAFVA